jgi:hypothetical protein
MAIDATKLRHDVDELLTDAETVINLAEHLPLPAVAENFVTKAQAVLADVQEFLQA